MTSIKIMRFTSGETTFSCEYEGGSVSFKLYNISQNCHSGIYKLETSEKEHLREIFQRTIDDLQETIENINNRIEAETK